MKILLVYPEYPDSFWSFKHALKFVSKKASFPPLGLLTIASMFPKDWELKLINMNAEKLADMDIKWADYVFLSAMAVQSKSVDKIIQKCKTNKTQIVAGGPLFTSCYQNYPDIDYFVLNEAEITLPRFLSDLLKGKLQRIYTTNEWADITTTQLPMYSLVKQKHYTSMNIQYSRGCPYDCEFCDITVLYGRVPRTKTSKQVINELENLYKIGWRGPVFFVDDNFIGNKQKLKNEILPVIADWMKQRNHPFYLNTETSINLADDEKLLKLMVEAGFEAVFIGIESPNEKSLAECNKTQNKNRDMLASIKKIQSYGLEVQGGFIVGFDNDPPSIFDNVAAFIQESGIVTAMVGLLNAPKGTNLEKRLLTEGRMIKEFSGNNTDFSINFIPKMNMDELLAGYKKILDEIYSPKKYYARILKFLKEFEPKKKMFHFNSNYMLAFIKSIIRLGIIGEERFYYWKIFFWSLFRKPSTFSMAIVFSIYGFHFRKISNQY